MPLPHIPPSAPAPATPELAERLQAQRQRHVPATGLRSCAQCGAPVRVRLSPRPAYALCVACSPAYAAAVAHTSRPSWASLPAEEDYHRAR